MYEVDHQAVDRPLSLDPLQSRVYITPSVLTYWAAGPGTV